MEEMLPGGMEGALWRVPSFLSASQQEPHRQGEDPEESKLCRDNGKVWPTLDDTRRRPKTGEVRGFRKALCERGHIGEEEEEEEEA